LEHYKNIDITDVPLNTWTHFLINYRWDGDSVVLDIYQNKVLDVSIDTGVGRIVSSSETQFGGCDTGCAQRHFKGMYVLSQEEIDAEVREVVGDEIDLTLSVATLKDSYNVREKIELTDPPDVEDMGVKNSEVIEINDNSIISKQENIILNSEQAKLPVGRHINKETKQYLTVIDEKKDKDSYYQFDLKGYIVQFKDKPVLEKKNELDKIAEENKEYVEEAAVYNPVKIYRQVFLTMPEDVQEKVEKYSKDLEKKNDKIKEKILSSQGGGKGITGNVIKRFFYKITGKAIGEDSESDLDSEVIINEFETAFNGVALDITDEEAEEIKKNKDVKEVYPNMIVETTLMDSVPLINADDVWQLDEDGNDCLVSGNDCLTGEGVTIAIIDTGIDYTHEDFGSCSEDEFLSENCEKVIGGWDFINNDNDPMDDHGHGTHCAGIATGNGVLKGVAPDAKLYAYKVLSSGGSGSFSQVIAGIERAVDPNQDGDFSDKVNIISMSLGGSGNPDDPVSQAVDNAVESGTIVVVAAGNSGPGSETIKSPGTARKVITVGATYKRDYNGTYWNQENPRTNEITSFSSRGPVEWEESKILKPDIVAPGAIICSSRYDNIFPEGTHNYYKPCLDENHVQLAGTSMATPMVAGAAALLKQKNPDWNPEEIKMALRNTAVDIGEEINTQGYGRVDTLEAVRLEGRPPIAKIETNGVVSGEIDIVGSAYGENFESYTLHYLSEEEFNARNYNWIEIHGSSSQVERGLLYNWDIISLPEKSYILKLVVSGNNQISEDYAYIRVVNTEINFPDDLSKGYLNIDGPFIFKVDERLEIKGTASGESFENYSIEWCNMNNECSEEGISLTNNGEQPVIKDVLAYWDIPNTIEYGYYHLRLINKYNNQVHEHEIKIYIETELQEGWPKKIEVEGGGGGWAYSFMRQPTIADINGNGKNDIVITYGEYVYVYNHDGSFADGFPVRISGRGIMQQGAAIADLDSDGDNEIVIGDNAGYLHIIKNDGTYLEGWPKHFGGYINLVSIEDINNNGQKEIIFGNWGSQLRVVDIEGDYLPGWPKYLSPISDCPNGKCLYGMIYEPISIADLDNDGNKEIIASLREYDSQTNINAMSLHIFDKEGNNLSGWPRSFSPWEYGLETFIVDINNDGNLEILYALGHYIHALDFQGNEILGFPFRPDDYERDLGRLIIGDLDNDGILEIVIGTRFFQESPWIYKNCLFVYEYNNGFNLKQGFPICNRDYINNKHISTHFEGSGLQLGNLDGLNNQIVVASLGESSYGNVLPSFFMFNSDGTIPNNIPKGMDDTILGIDSTPIGDLDNDGDNEIMVYTWKGNLFIWDLEGNSENNEWPQFHHDPQHTGNYHFRQTVPQPPRPQSKIVNNEEFNLTGQLIMKLQKEINGSWQDEQIVVNQQISIPANRLIKLDIGKDSLGNQVFTGWNPQNIVTYIPGQYRTYIEFEYNRKVISDNWEFEVI